VQIPGCISRNKFRYAYEWMLFRITEACPAGRIPSGARQQRAAGSGVFRFASIA